MGGAERQLLYLTRDMDRRRFAPVVISLRTDTPLASQFRANGIDLVELGYRGRHDIGVIGRITRVLRERRVRVACPYLWPGTLWGYAALRRARIGRWVASERNSGAVYDPRLQLAVENRILARAPVLVAITRAARDFAVARGVAPGRIRIIHIGVPPLRSTVAPSVLRRELGVPPDAPVVGCIARFWPQKDHATLLRAAAQVLERIPRARLVLVGDGPLRRAAERLAADLGIAARVHFLGIRIDAINWLSLFDVAVLASSRQEGCSNFLIESALMSKPVVATTVGGIPEAVQSGETGYLVPPEDPRAMADAVIRLLDDPTLAARMGAAASAWAEQRFSLRAMVAGWEDLLAEMAVA